MENKIKELIESYVEEYKVGSKIIASELLGLTIDASERDDYNHLMSKTNKLIEQLVCNTDFDSFKAILDYLDQNLDLFDDFPNIKDNLKFLLVTIGFEERLYKGREHRVIALSSQVFDNQLEARFYDFVIWFSKNFNIESFDLDELNQHLIKMVSGSFTLRNMVAGNYEAVQTLEDPKMFLQVELNLDQFASIYYQGKFDEYVKALNLVNEFDLDDTDKINYVLMLCSILDISKSKKYEIEEVVSPSSKTRADLLQAKKILDRYYSRTEKGKEKK